MHILRHKITMLEVEDPASLQFSLKQICIAFPTVRVGLITCKHNCGRDGGGSAGSWFVIVEEKNFSGLL